MNNLQMQGKQKFMGVSLPILTGGFGEDSRCVLARDIAKIHNMELKEINQSLKILINKNRIKEGIHYIDLLDDNFKVSIADLQIKTSNGQKNAFLLSERGYASLIKYMDDDKSWEVHDKFVDEYFKMEEIIEEVSKNYSLRLDNLTRLFNRAYPQQYESVAKEILDFHFNLGIRDRLDIRHKHIKDQTEYKQFARDKVVEALKEIQKDVTNKDIVSIQLYARELIINLQKDYRVTNNISDGKILANKNKTYSKDMIQMGKNTVELIKSFADVEQAQ